MAAIPSKSRLLVFAPHCRITPSRSGIHRVAMRLIEHLPKYAQVDLVKWDDIEGQLRYCDKNDLRRYFGETTPEGITVHPHAQRIDYRFADTIAATEDVSVLMPEPSHLIENGQEIYGRVICQCAAEGWRTASIFYDLIPLKNPGYAERHAFAHGVAELTRVDVVLPISRFSEADLLTYWTDNLGLDVQALAASGQRITAVPLPDRDRETAFSADGERERDKIVLLGTIEPRKQQVRVVRAFQKLKLGERGLKLSVIGSMNPRSDVEFRALTSSDPTITWLPNASDAEVDDIFASSRFSVFCSAEEGFGLPIVESLCRGVPCITANHGAMKEAAAGGGCVLVDVDDDEAIEAEMLRLSSDDIVVEDLRREIARRKWRTWDNYAAEVLSAVDNCQPPSIRSSEIAGIVSKTFSSGARRHGAETASQSGSDDDLQVFVLEKDQLDPRDGDKPYIVCLSADIDPDDLAQEKFDLIVGADAWFCRRASAYDAIVARAVTSGVDGLLSGHCGYASKREDLVALVASEVGKLATMRRRRIAASTRDVVYRRALARLDVPRQKPTLAIVISVFNGEEFIERNIDHTLRLIAPCRDAVRLVIVDNASTDGTAGKIERYATRGDIDCVRVSSNTGLLGNLHTISALFLARHVWAIGLDDIIIPGAIERILAVLEKEPDCPFILPNFAVYHRDSFAPTDTCQGLVDECRPVGVDPAPDEMTIVRRATSHHDNLLTAFYIIVFRSDLMATVFNNPFTAPFFGSLVDTIPTTKAMFELFPEFSAAWLSEPVVAGNSRNSWRHHRVAWHGVLMPQAFELARDAGLDRNRLREWSRHHVHLLEEAKELYPNPNVSSSFPAEVLASSFRVFGSRLLAAPSPSSPRDGG